MTKPRLELDAELALRTIREECGVDANGFGGDRARLAFRSGQLCVTLILARHGRRHATPRDVARETAA